MCAVDCVKSVKMLCACAVLPRRSVICSAAIPFDILDTSIPGHVIVHLYHSWVICVVAILWLLIVVWKGMQRTIWVQSVVPY